MPARRARSALSPPLAAIALLATAGLGFGAALSASAEEGWFVTAAGARIETPALAKLDCAAMRAVLDAIDASGYRAGAPEPHDAADAALFEYENRLSAGYYADCVRAHAEDAAPQAAFAAGYETAGQ
ncbi:MAG: hypothetical protein ACFCUS_03725 [Rubrimonas sp.]|uniref:hypothetical protein n=1 Tax=Rubrimonas sp. TaxID=2036015 RepID=UPI002FDE594B